MAGRRPTLRINVRSAPITLREQVAHLQIGSFHPVDFGNPSRQRLMIGCNSAFGQNRGTPIFPRHREFQ